MTLPDQVAGKNVCFYKKSYEKMCISTKSRRKKCNLASEKMNLHRFLWSDLQRNYLRSGKIKR